MRNPQLIETTFGNFKNIHELYTGDSLKYMNSTPEKQVDLIITDPPYNLGLDYGVFKDRMPEEKYFNYIEERLEKSAQLLREGGSFYIITYPEIAARFYLDLKVKLNFQRWISWHYPTNIGHSKNNFTRSHRAILFFTRGKKYTFNRGPALRPYKNPTDKRIRQLIKQGSKGRMMYDTIFDFDLRYQQDLEDVIKLNLSKNISKYRESDHPCQLPISLLDLLIKVSSNVKDNIFDPFAGVFTTSFAAARIGRNSAGAELNPRYVKIGIERLKNINLNKNIY